MPLVIGVDESGKGDFFGPLVIAALLASDDAAPQLAELGVRDSKLISDNKLLQIDQKLREHFPHAIRIISPAEYNLMYARIKNLNVLLAQGHAWVIKTVLEQHHADLAISDQFGKPQLIEKALTECGCLIRLEQTVRAESIPQVGAASILARAEFVRQMKMLSESAGAPLPKGAGSPVDSAGAALVRAQGAAILDQVAKKHFKNYGRVISRAASLNK
ncbi:MAG: ribonuclease HIII [candidate division Zixibacteria bacterium]|nr:ribonuclease HIII [candidate division Zixibacteria bacterium]